ncbi:hypothetical protein BDW75DRAFT_34212 [Aspergillus navahoensis]
MGCDQHRMNEANNHNSPCGWPRDEKGARQRRGRTARLELTLSILVASHELPGNIESSSDNNWLSHFSCGENTVRRYISSLLHLLHLVEPRREVGGLQPDEQCIGLKRCLTRSVANHRSRKVCQTVPFLQPTASPIPANAIAWDLVTFGRPCGGVIGRGPHGFGGNLRSLTRSESAISVLFEKQVC